MIAFHSKAFEQKVNHCLWGNDQRQGKFPGRRMPIHFQVVRQNCIKVNIGRAVKLLCRGILATSKSPEPRKLL
jgi:hypothetical protein